MAYQIGDPDLKEETSLSTDLSLRWRSPRLQAKATIYRNAIDNYIFLVDTGEEAPDGSGLPVLRTTQADAELLGVDVSLQAQVLPWLQLRGTFETVEGENRDTGDKLPLLPATNYRAKCDLRSRRWQSCKISLSASECAIRAQKRQPGNSFAHPTKGGFDN